MATKFKTTKIETVLGGHGLATQGDILYEPHVVGIFDADPVMGNDGIEYGVFTIADEAPNLSGWAGTYRVPVSRMEAIDPAVFEK